MLSGQYLEFEQPIAELESKIKELRLVGQDSDLNLSEDIRRLEKKCEQLTRDIFKQLTPWQVTQLARHPLRPHGSDYIQHLFTDFDELSGDRHASSGASMIAGLARFEDQPVMVIANEKGRKTQEKIERNFGMPNPEDYRKALRLFQMAEKFSLPIFTFIDTPGAYPGIHAEEANQSEAIAKNLFVLSQLRTPIICTVTGEGGSGGALAIGVGDRVLMLQYSIYSVISPEGCASILWKSAEKAPLAAEAMGLTANKILELGLIDEVIAEPLGGAHKNIELTMNAVRDSLKLHLRQLKSQSLDQLLEARYQKLLSYGR